MSVGGQNLILLDTSFILNALKFKAFDIVELKTLAGPARIAIPSAVASELAKLGHLSVLEFLERSGVEKLDGGETYADREILKIVKSFPGKVIVATQDSALRAKLKAFKAKCGVIIVRGRKKMHMVEFGGTG
jgi:rRNA-processing protein FCF1